MEQFKHETLAITDGKLHQVKFLKDKTGCSLFDAKTTVERWLVERENGFKESLTSSVLEKEKEKLDNKIKRLRAQLYLTEAYRNYLNQF